MKIYIDEKIPHSEHFFHSFNLETEKFSDSSFEIEKLDEPCVVVVRSTYKTHKRNVPECVKYLCSVSTGEDHIDKQSLERKNIKYGFSTGANAIAVQEYFYSCLSKLILENKYDPRKDKILIIGAGNIGAGIKNVLDHFNIKSDTYDPFKGSSLDSLNNLSAYKLITLHVPYTETGDHPTKYLVDASFLSKLSKGTVIINTSRGGVVSEEDFLHSKDLFLISDVFEGEPNLSSKFCEKNYYFTPHIAGHSQFSRYAMTRMAFHNVADYLNIDVIEPESILVNKEEYQTKEIINDFKNFLFPVSLILKTYNFTKDVFEPSSFKKIRDDYNDRVGFSQVNIKDCNDPQIKKSLEILGFKVI